MKKQLHVKNHFVPECYLKRWTNDQEKVLVYRTLVNHPNVPVWKSHSVASVAYQKHLYNQIVSGRESDEIESWLDREFESPANEILDKATSEGELTSSDWEILIKFLAAQDVRTPARLFEHIQRAQKELPEILYNVMSEVEGKIKSGDANEFKTKKKRPVEPFPLKITTCIEDGADTGTLEAETYAGRSTWLYSIKYLLENTRKVLHSHKWSIIKPAKGYYWPTSDNPVVKLNYYSSGNYDLKGGWGVEKGNIFFPIDPEHAMFVQVGGRPIQKNTRASESQTREFIKFIAENAHRKIFSHYNNEDLPRLRKRVIDPVRLSREKKEIED